MGVHTIEQNTHAHIGHTRDAISFELGSIELHNSLSEVFVRFKFDHTLHICYQPKQHGLLLILCNLPAAISTNLAKDDVDI